MGRILKTFVILLVVFFAGGWAVERFVDLVESYHASREELAREAGRKKGEEIKRTIEAGQAVRAEQLREQLDASNALQSTTPPRAVDTQPLRGQLDAAARQQQSRADALPR
ncbi:MAG: hypothetical protein H0X65_17430 [Gemmatimonadetes bacterium]|nr:hypothetical protein [Gemmatimonadota bacterium]